MQSTLGALVSAISFIILQIIIIRIYIEYDQLKYQDKDEKAKRATKLTRIMYYYIAIYSALVIVKLILDYNNDQRIDNE